MPIGQIIIASIVKPVYYNLDGKNGVNTIQALLATLKPDENLQLELYRGEEAPLKLNISQDGHIWIDEFAFPQPTVIGRR